MTQENFLSLANLGVNCEGGKIAEEVAQQLLRGIGLSEAENKLFLLPADRFAIDRKILLNALCDDQEGTLGEGSYSWIVPGGDRNTAQEVAVKVMKRPFDNKNIVESFAREARLMLMLNHPNILNIRGLTVIDNCGELIPVIIMDKAEGDLEGKPNISPVLVSDIVLGLAGALDYLRERHVLYGDVCPENVLKVKTKAGFKFVLADFGVAIDWRGREARWIEGHGKYAAPELINRASILSERLVYPEECKQADQHALAAMTFKLLTNPQFLWMDLDGYKKDEHISSDIVLNRDLPVDAEVYRVLVRATDYCPEKRYTTCVEFALALKEVIEV